MPAPARLTHRRRHPLKAGQAPALRLPKSRSETRHLHGARNPEAAPGVSPLLLTLASSWVPLRIYIEEILSALRVLGEWTGFRREENEVTRTSYPRNSPSIGKKGSRERPI